MTRDELIAHLEAADWTFAKTAIKNPHYYTLHFKWETRQLFEEAVAKIRELGETVMFWGKPYICYDVNGFRYWSMGFPVSETTLINRRPLESHEIRS